MNLLTLNSYAYTDSGVHVVGKLPCLHVTRLFTCIKNYRNKCLKIRNFNETGELTVEPQSKLTLIRSRKSGKWVIFQVRSVIWCF
jgi:hypothetical protein